MSEINHEAAKEIAKLRMDGFYPQSNASRLISEAYLDLDAQLTAERARVEALCDLIHDANGAAYPFGDMQVKMTAILEGRDHA